MRSLYRRRAGGGNSVIVFEDPAVKQVCVSQWGGGEVSNEITVSEAAKVTTLNNAFKGNVYISKFNELRYFVGITSLNSQFYGCTNLSEVTIPKANIGDFTDAFRNCHQLRELDITPTKAATINVEGMARVCMRLVKLRIPGVAYSAFQYAVNNDILFTTLEIDGTADFSGVSSFSNAFYGDSSFTTISGSMTGIKANVGFGDSLLTRESALAVLNGLDEVQSSRTVTFSPHTFSLLTDENIDIAIEKGWQVASV